MRKVRIAERILSQVLTRERAASAVGDWMEDIGERGSAWFWSCVLRTAISRVWSDLTESPPQMAGLAFRAWLRLWVFLITYCLVLSVVLLIGMLVVGAIRYGLKLPALSYPDPRGNPLAVGLLWAFVSFRAGQWIAQRAPGREVAATLDRLIGGGGQVFFGNSGAEANECAIKLARKWAGHGRYVVLSAYGSFHGRTLATLHATGQPAKHEAFQPLPDGFRHVAWQDIEALEKAVTPEVAAILLEPVQGEGGVWPAGPEYFQAVRRLCDERDLLFMVDEVQTGLGRTGRWWGFQHYGIRPDVVTVAKALGNGVPIGACWARSEVASAFVPGDHATTFGGQPLAASAAQATLAVMEAVDAPDLARLRGQYLRDKLSPLPSVRAVRGLGLLLGVEVAGTEAKAVAAKCMQQGLVVNAVTDSALRLAPSLLVSEAEIDEAVEILGRVLEAASP